MEEKKVGEDSELTNKEVILEDEEEISLDTEEKNKGKKGLLYEWGLPIIAAVVLAVIINKFVIFKVYIPSESMVPTLNVGDRLFVSRVYNPENLDRGDVVVFYSEELQDSLIKRLIGLPGDNVTIHDGKVIVNGEALEEEYIGNQDRFTGTYVVPEGEYFFLGDNRLWSKDSRYWDDPYIEAKDIKGKAQVKVYPFSDMGRIE